MDDPYTTLGVSRESSLEEIKRAFHKLAHRWHPDKAGGDEAVFKKISSAWAFLQQRHVQRPKAPSRSETGAGESTGGRFNPDTLERENIPFYEYDGDTGRWYSSADLDVDGFVVPTTSRKETPEDFKAKVAKLRASRIGKKPEPYNYTQDFKRKNRM